METIYAKATKEQVKSLMAKWPTVQVDERFTPDSVNLFVHTDIIDAVLEWFEQQEIEATFI